MKRVYVNEQWCLGCHLCEYYCAFANSGKSDMVKALKGVIMVGDVSRAGIYTDLIRKKKLLSEIDFDLIRESPQLMAFSQKDRRVQLGGEV